MKKKIITTKRKIAINRRSFFKLLGATTLVSIASVQLKAVTSPSKKIIIIGAGFGGSTCAKYLKLWGGSNIDVTIIDKNENYSSPILSNLILNSEKTLNELTFTHSPLITNYKVNFINKKLLSINSDEKSITLDDGSSLNYDKLVLATGIDFTYTNKYDTTKVPHAWEGGEALNILKKKIDTLETGDTFIMTIPKSPYRCPPGPYERACVIADYLKNSKKLTVKIIVLDENIKIIAEEDIFKKKFNDYGIDYRPNSEVTHVDDANMEITYGDKKLKLKAKVLNVIPNQKASKIIFDSSLNTDGEDWAKIDTINYESTIKKDIHIIGDSQGSSQPKAGHIANSEAKVCADAILRELNNKDLYQAPKTNSACYSPTSLNEAIWLTAVYEYDSKTKDMKLVNGKNYPIFSKAPSTSNYNDMFHWSGNLFSDTFK